MAESFRNTSASATIVNVVTSGIKFTLFLAILQTHIVIIIGTTNLYQDTMRRIDA